MVLLAPHLGLPSVEGISILADYRDSAAAPKSAVSAPPTAARHGSKNAGIACRRRARSTSVGCSSNCSAAVRIVVQSKPDLIKIPGSYQSFRAAAQSSLSKGWQAQNATAKACWEVSCTRFSLNENLNRPVTLQTLPGPLMFVQQALCSLVLAAALFCPGLAVAEGLRNVPSVKDQDLPSRSASVEHRISNGNEFAKPRVDAAKQGEWQFSNDPIGAVAPALGDSATSDCTCNGNKGLLQIRSAELLLEWTTGNRVAGLSINSGSKERLDSCASFAFSTPEPQPLLNELDLPYPVQPAMLDHISTSGVEMPFAALTHQPSWGANTPLYFRSSQKAHLDREVGVAPGKQMPAGSPLQSFQTHTVPENRPLGLRSSFTVISEFSSQGLGSSSRTAANRFSHLGSLGLVASPVQMVSQRPHSSRLVNPSSQLVNPVFQDHQRVLHRKNRQRKVAVAALPAANQALNQGVSQALSNGGLNEFAELAVGAAKKAFNVGVLGATAGASLKLFTVCGLVVWMQKSGRLPETTPAVLSQVAFRLLIPCFLMSKVAVTLYSDFSPALLAVPVAAVVQILLGAGMGRLAAHFAYGQPPLVPAHFEAHQPTRASSLVASSVAIATGQPDVAVALTAPKGVGAAKLGASKEALMTATSAFGNSLTLPLVFLSALLDRTGADKAAGYLALYMVGWSPALWTFGYKIIAGSSDDPNGGDESDYEGEGRWQAFLTWLGRVMNPPLYGVFLGLLIGATPLAHLFLPPATAAAENLANATSISPLTVLATLTSGIFRPVMEAASLLGTATLAVQTVVLASSLAASIPSRLHSLSAGSQPFSATPVVNPNPLTDVLREGEGPVTSVLSDSSSPNPQRRRARRLKEGPDAANVLDGRAVWVVSGVRLLMLPLVNLFLTLGLMRAHILPADPICGLVLMAEAAMPSAQNLVLLAQLKAKTRPLAGMVAGLLLRQYALSILPITFWMAIFLSVLGLAT